MIEAITSMSKSQKIIIATLTVVAMIIFCALVGTIAALMAQRSASEATPPAIVQPPLDPSATPEPSATPGPLEIADLAETTTEPTETATPTITPTNTRVVSDTATPTNTRTVADTATPTNTATPLPEEVTEQPQPLPSQEPNSENSNKDSETEWSPYESSRNNVTVEHPTHMEIVETSGGMQFSGGEVDLEQGTIEQPIVMLHFYQKNSSYLPENVDRSDPVALVSALRDIYFAGQEDQLHELQPPQQKMFNGYSGAMTVVNRIEPGRTDLYGAVDIVFYFAVIIHEDRIVRAQIQARKHNGGELIPFYAERVLNTLELW